MRRRTALTIDAADNLIVVDFMNQRLQWLNLEGGFIDQWGTTGSIGFGSGNFNYPMDIAASPDGKTIYAADSYNDRVQVFGPDGRFKFKWGGPFSSNLFLSYYHWFPFDGWFSVASALEIQPL